MLVVVALLGLVGCGDDDAGPIDSATTALPAEGGASDGSGDGRDAADDPVVPAPTVVGIEADPCDLLGADEVASAVGVAVVATSSDRPTECGFDLGAEAGVQVVLVVDDGAGGLIAPSWLFDEYLALVADGEAEMVDGVGERAVYATPYRAIAVDVGGGRYLAVLVNGGYAELAEPRDALVELGRLAASRA